MKLTVALAKSRLGFTKCKKNRSVSAAPPEVGEDAMSWGDPSGSPQATPRARIPTAAIPRAWAVRAKRPGDSEMRRGMGLAAAQPNAAAQPRARARGARRGWVPGFGMTGISGLGQQRRCPAGAAPRAPWHLQSVTVCRPLRSHATTTPFEPARETLTHARTRRRARPAHLKTRADPDDQYHQCHDGTRPPYQW